MSKHDQAALDAATEIMSLVNGPVGLSSDAKLKANIQVVLIDLLEKHATQPAAGEPVYQYRSWRNQQWIDTDPAGLRSAAESGWETRTLWTAPPAAAPVAAGEPVAPKEVGEMIITVRDGMTWFAFEEYGEAYKLPEGLHYLYTAPPAAAHGDEAPGTVRVTADWLKTVHRDLDACQKVIWLAGCRPRVPGGFDPAYCEDAQARLKEIDEHIARAQGDEGAA